MAFNTSCIETVRSGDTYYLLDNKDYSLGPLAVLGAAEYDARLEVVKTEGDPTSMFDSPAGYVSLSNGELSAYVSYAVSGVLDAATIGDLQSVTAYEDRRGIVDVPRKIHILTGCISPSSQV